MSSMRGSFSLNSLCSVDSLPKFQNKVSDFPVAIPVGVSWSVFQVGIRDQFQMPLTVALNRKQIIQGAVHFDMVKIILVHLFLPLKPTLAGPRFC